MSDTGSASAAVLPELFNQYLFESVRAALAAGLSASQWASQLATGVPSESGAFTTEPLEKYIALDEGETVRWRKGNNTYSTLITSQNNNVIIGCSTTDDDAGALTKSFLHNVDTGITTSTGGFAGTVAKETGNWTTSDMPKHTVVPEGSVVRFAKGAGYGSLGIVKVDESLYVYLSVEDDDSAARTQLFKLNSDGLLSIPALIVTVGGADGTPVNISGGISLRGGLQGVASNSHATDAPGVADSAPFYRKGDIWVRESTGKVYACLDNASGAAVWAILN